MARGFSDEGVVLSRRKYSEGDRIITLLTKNHGKLSVMAKGVRKPRSKKRGHLESFSFIKFSVATTKGMPILTEAETISSFEDVRKDLKKTSVAYFLLEVASKLSVEGEGNYKLYNLLVDNLKKLSVSKNLKELRINFVSQALIITGFWQKGLPIADVDQVFEEVTERHINTKRVGKKLLS